jgi:hypothetical protein
MPVIDKSFIIEYVFILVISFSYRFLFRHFGYRYYEKVWTFIHKKFPKASDRFNWSFYLLFLYCWVAGFFAGVIFHMAGNMLGEYLFIGTYIFVTSPALMFMDVWRYDASRAADHNATPDGATIIRRRKIRNKIILYTVGLAVVIGAAVCSYAYYAKVYGPNECVKLAAAKDVGLAASLKAENKSLGLTATSFVDNKCYEDISYTIIDSSNAALTNVYSYIEDIHSNKTVSSCRSQDDHGPKLPPGCLQYHKDFYKLFLQVDFDEKKYLAP